jgi:hypothetical protein
MELSRKGMQKKQPIILIESSYQYIYQLLSTPLVRTVVAFCLCQVIQVSFRIVSPGFMASFGGFVDPEVR